MAVLVAAVSFAAAAPAQAAPGMEIALQDDFVYLNRDYFDREVGLWHAHEIGVTRLRVNVYWAEVVGAQALLPVRPERIDYRWEKLDTLVEDAGRYGIRLQLTLSGPAPAWATGNGRVGGYLPRPDLFREFARAAAEHFRGRIDRYSIWNEPNFRSWLQPQGTCPASGRRGYCMAAQIYRSLYRSAYSAIKSADPRALVLIGETSPFGQRGKAIPPLVFLRAMACRDADYRPVQGCAGLRSDGFAHHPYQFKTRPERAPRGQHNVSIGSLSRLTNALDVLAETGALRTPRGRPLDLFLTEFGYFSQGRRALPEHTRAAWTLRAFKIAQRNSRVRQMLQYLLVHPPPAVVWQMGLMSHLGGSQRPFVALRRWSARAARRGMIRPPGTAVRMDGARSGR